MVPSRAKGLLDRHGRVAVQDRDRRFTATSADFFNYLHLAGKAARGVGKRPGVEAIQVSVDKTGHQLLKRFHVLGHGRAL